MSKQSSEESYRLQSQESRVRSPESGDQSLRTKDSRLKTKGSRLQTKGSRLQTKDSRLQTKDSRLNIVVDTREQMPYAFDPDRFRVERRHLPAGDYSLSGLETRVAVERKSLNDFAQTVIRNRKRFYKELRKLATYDRACIVVEGSMRDILAGTYGTGAHPNSVFGTTISICVDWDVPVHFCGDRQVARVFVEAWLERCAGAINECNLE